MRHGPEMPDIRQDAASVVLQDRSQFSIRAPGPHHCLLEDLLFLRSKAATFRRNIGVGAIEAHVTLALLLRIVKRVSVQERPHELPADVLEAKFEMRVLINGVMAREKC